MNQNDLSRKLKRKKTKEQKMKKSEKVVRQSGEKEKTKPKKSSQVVHHSGKKVKSKPKFYSNQESKSISSSEAERRKQQYKKMFIDPPMKSGGKVMPETRSDEKVNIMIIKVSLFLSRLLIQDIGQEVTRMIEEEMEK